MFAYTILETRPNYLSLGTTSNDYIAENGSLGTTSNNFIAGNGGLGAKRK